MTERYYSYLKSKEWQDLKIDIINARGANCERCRSKKSLYSLQLHHLSYERLYNELPQDLMLVCASCHMKEHNLKTTKSGKVVKVTKPKKKKPSVAVVKPAPVQEKSVPKKRIWVDAKGREFNLATMSDALLASIRNAITDKDKYQMLPILTEIKKRSEYKKRKPKKRRFISTPTPPSPR